MKYIKTKIPGVVIIEIDRLEDERGFFARTWDEGEAQKRNMPHGSFQFNISSSLKKGTLRGMHYQVAPHEEAKLVRCTRGAIYDVALDLRQDSPTYKEWIAQELSADTYRSMYIPKGCAHGFQTLEENTEVFYQMGDYFHPESARGVRFDDPAFSFEWPETAEQIISEKDRSYLNWHI